LDLLLDTHACLWWASDPSLLSPGAAAAIAEPANDVWVSAASAWELAIKVRAGKLDVDVTKLFAELAQRGLGLLGIGIDDAVLAGGLPWAHRDPFDRMLAAQAQRSGYVLVTRDADLRAFLTDLVLPA
jgi:PIN domain nuclease of toxin-antitoxin system